MEFLTNAWLLVALFIIIMVTKWMLPVESYKNRYSLCITITGLLFFAIVFLSSVRNDNINPWPLVSCVICGVYIAAGGKTVQAKTVSGVQSNITKKFVGTVKAGSMNWIDPIFEKVTISVDGIPNISADLQELEITIPETPLMRTCKPGIQAKVKEISFMLELDGDKIFELLEIEGGATTVRGRIVKYIDEFFLVEISKKSPDDLDQDKEKTIEKLVVKLKEEVNKFCKKNKYPYEVIGDVIIADTELEAKYYEVLAKQEYAKLEQKAKDIEAVSLRERITAFGEHNLPNGSKKEQTDHALIALGIVKKDIRDNKYSIDSELVQLAKDIALYFKKN